MCGFAWKCAKLRHFEVKNAYTLRRKAELPTGEIMRPTESAYGCRRGARCETVLYPALKLTPAVPLPGTRQKIGYATAPSRRKESSYATLS